MSSRGLFGVSLCTLFFSIRLLQSFVNFVSSSYAGCPLLFCARLLLSQRLLPASWSFLGAYASVLVPTILRASLTCVAATPPPLTVEHRPFDSFAKPRMRICLLGDFSSKTPSKNCVETMGVAGVYSKAQRPPRKASASEAPELRTAPSFALCWAETIKRSIVRSAVQFL